tara:strand:+ start:414 stop:872 length:459 start_codon:yes stop_codon:yes gene_type:complete
MNPKMTLLKQNEEVYYLKDKYCDFSDAFNFLINQSKINVRKTARICFHQNINSPIHQMLICHHKSFFVRPHKHISKDETCIILKGKMKLSFYDTKGNTTKSILLEANKKSFIKIEKKLIHSMIMQSNYVIFLEITKGPFKKLETIFPIFKKK